MLCFPNAKINIGLHVTEKRTDGFHNIQTVFYPVELSDILEWKEENVDKYTEIRFDNTGLIIDSEPKNNLCIKAYHLLYRHFQLPAISIHLHKIIPLGAGLGGGSSDGAFMIKTMNSHFNMGLSDEDLMDYARKLGSDCAFFIKNKPVFAHGKGDCFEPVSLKLESYFIVIIFPKIHVSTKEAYEGVRPKMPEVPLKEALKQPVKEWKEIVCNDFEKNIFAKYPQILAVKKALYKNGAAYASMSGSGAAVFGIFEFFPSGIQKIFPGYFCKVYKL